MEAAESPVLDPHSYDNSLQVRPTSDLSDSECDLFQHLKSIEDGEWTESDESMVLLCRASGSSAKAQLAAAGLCDPMAAYLSEEFKAFLEKRGTYKQLEKVVSGVLLQLLQAKKADGSPLFVVKPNENMSDKETSMSTSNLGQVGVTTDISPSLTVSSLIDVLDQGPSTTETISETSTETTTGTCDIQEREQSFHLQIGQQETRRSQESIHVSSSECLRKIALDIPDNVKTSLRHDLVSRRRLSQIPPRYTGHLPAASDARCVSDSTMTLHGILQAALSSMNRQIKREIALSHKLGMIVSPLTDSQ